MKKIFSVLTEDLEHCIETGKSPVHLHHIFFGKNRKNSEIDGYVIPLSPELHNMSKAGIHFDQDFDLKWKRKAQEHFEKTHSRAEFIKRYGKSYIW